jgi:hypothetical protein
MHAYTENNNEEIPLRGALRGDFDWEARRNGPAEGNLDSREVYQTFPFVSRLCAGRKKGVIYQRSPMIIRSKKKRLFIGMIHR